VWRGVAIHAIHSQLGIAGWSSASSSSHGYTVGLMGVDEAWGIRSCID
jgi:hypothetical protein